VLVVCFTLLVLPAGLVAVAVRYQQELRWGVGYLRSSMGTSRSASSARRLLAAVAEAPVVPLALIVAIGLVALAALNAEGSDRAMLAWQPVAEHATRSTKQLRAGLLD
jgi:hypothetical protein